jgi:heterodisulfide reductase subunit C
VLGSLKTIDKNLHYVIADIMEEKRDEFAEWLEEQAEE